MSAGNTTESYGSVAKTIHWLTAALILANIPLGLLGVELAHQIRAGAASQAQIDLTTLIFSIHKTTGVAVFLLALLRILWGLGQVRPGLLNGDRRGEATLAVTIHWLLYALLLAVPLSGWVHHAAETGLAPIWWPFGQSLPFVPKDEGVSQLASQVHYVLQWGLIGALSLHIAGALKHHLIDRDATLRRMLPGGEGARPTVRQPGHALPALLAAALLAAGLGGAGAAGWLRAAPGGTPAPKLAAVQSDWQVQQGTLGLTITQMGNSVTGQFADWTAQIAYDPQATGDGPAGHVEVTVSIPSLSLGSVTDQAMSADFLNADTFPKARYEGDIFHTPDGLELRGTLTLDDHAQPLTMPFSLQIDGATATAKGGAEVDRRDFGIGNGVQQEGTLGFAVEIGFALTATRAAP